jgi:hypothetical protein
MAGGADDDSPFDTTLPSSRDRVPRQIRPGDTLGRYTIGDELGEGGMAMVFRARDRELRRDVAVKVLFPHLARRAEIVHRFHREARAAAALAHPNILRIFDVGGGEADEPPYIVMELIRGRTLLAEIEARGALLAEVVACVGAVLGDALGAAHAAGVIHRDIKPGNVLIAHDGRVLLADFGVARLEAEDSLITRTGALLGTPAYMSPEQASGEVATAQSDVYSLGATLYQLATGALPYAGAPAKVLARIAAGALVPPVQRRPAIGAELSRLIVGAMARDPSARPASAAALADELRGFAAAGGLGDARDELAAYFAGPDAFLQAHVPGVVRTLLAAARAALRAAKLPRAMSLVDRACVLAPGDPAVLAMVSAVMAGEHASRRRRGLAIGGIAVALVGGMATVGWRVMRAPGEGDAVHEAVISAGAKDAAIDVRIDARVDAVPRVVEAIAPIDAAIDARVAIVARASIDAGPGRAPPPPADAEVALATAPPPPDAASPDAPSGPGYVIVANDVWCNVWIDASNRGSRRNEPVEVTAGHHVVRCENPSLGDWVREVDVAPGATVSVYGALLREIAVKLDVDATIGGRHYQRGTVAPMWPGSIEVVAGGKTRFITFRENCTLRDSPDLGCYR